MGGRGPGRAPARPRQADGARAHRRRYSMPVRSASGAASPAKASTTRPGSWSRFRASSCLGGRGTIDGRPVAVQRRRFHGARRLVRELQPRKERAARAAGGRVRVAARPPARRHGRRRLGGRDREARRDLRALVPGFEQVVANLGTVPVVSLGLGPDRRPRRSAAGREPLLADGARHLRRCSRPARRSSRRRARR